MWNFVIVFFFFFLCVTCVHSSFAIFSMGKRELVALLCLSPWCLMIVVWHFLTMSWVCLQFVIVVFPNHTYYLGPSMTYNHVDFDLIAIIIVKPVPALNSNNQ